MLASINPAAHLLDRYRAGPRLKSIDRSKWPATYRDNPTVLEVWISTSFLVQVYDQDGHTRLSINRVSTGTDGRWRDGITWDRLQEIKAEIGRGDHWAIEIYPPDAAVVNVANIRHLWLIDEPPPFAWNKARTAPPAGTTATCVCGLPIVMRTDGRWGDARHGDWLEDPLGHDHGGHRPAEGEPS